jgi:hypothetical protein
MEAPGDCLKNNHNMCGFEAPKTVFYMALSEHGVPSIPTKSSFSEMSMNFGHTAFSHTPGYRALLDNAGYLHIYIYRYIDEISHYNTYYFLYDMPNACYSPDILLADSSRISELPAHCLPARCGSEQYSIKL